MSQELNDDQLRAQINALILDEIQDNINEYVDAQEETKKGGLGFVPKEGEEELVLHSHHEDICYQYILHLLHHSSLGYQFYP